MPVDWKRVAADRLRTIRSRDRQLAHISERTAEIVARELLSNLHARCITIGDERTRKMVAEIGAQVAEALTGVPVDGTGFLNDDDNC